MVATERQSDYTIIVILSMNYLNSSEAIVRKKYQIRIVAIERNSHEVAKIWILKGLKTYDVIFPTHWTKGLHVDFESFEKVHKTIK